MHKLLRVAWQGRVDFTEPGSVIVEGISCLNLIHTKQEEMKMKRGKL